MKRLKKTLKWTGVVLGGLVAIGLVANAVFVWTTDTRLEHQLAAIREAGDPLTLAELASKPVPPDKNAVTYLRRAQSDVDAIWDEISNAKVRSVSVWPLPPMSMEDRKTLETVFNAYPNAIPLLKKAAACPDYDAQLDYTLSSSEFIGYLCDSELLQNIRRAACVLRAQALLQANEQNCDEAVRTALTLFRLARHFDHNPMIISYLVAIVVREMAVGGACAALQAGSVSNGVRDALENELAIQERMSGYIWMVKSERAYGLACFGDFPARNFWLVARGYLNRAESDYLQAMHNYLEIAQGQYPYQRAMQLIHRTTPNSATSRLGKTFVGLIAPAMQSVHVAVTRTLAEIRCLRVLNALQTHVTAGSSAVPKLTEIGLPTETITDPFNGEPLHVKKTERGWLVYSVGPNLRDDGGNLDDPLNGDVGVGPPSPIASPDKNNGEKKK